MGTAGTGKGVDTQLRRLPGDEVRRVLWRFEDRPELHEIIRSARKVARGPVARLVASGARDSREWTEEKAQLLAEFDRAGLTSLVFDRDLGGPLETRRNLALALASFELAWVDGGAATTNLAGYLALAPILLKGTPQQKRKYAERCLPAKAAGGAKPWRGAFCLTEPLPHVGVDTGILAGRVTVEKWEPGKEPILLVEKSGRFINNMDFANFVVAAVAGADERIEGTCMILLEEGDPGVFDRGEPTPKLVQQISSTRDPVFRLTVPASRILGGYSVRDGVLVPNLHHGEILEAVFRRMRVTVSLMTASKLLSAVEPVIRYQRERYRGRSEGTPGSPREELGLQQKEDAIHRLVDVWAAGEAAASLGFATARRLDAFDAAERRKDEVLAAQGVTGPRSEARALEPSRRAALEYFTLAAKPKEERNPTRLHELRSDPLVDYVMIDAVVSVLGPAAKLWNTGHGTNMLREAVNLMGGYGLMEGCPGFVGQKWMDAQLEATYEGPEAVHRRQLSAAMTDDVFLAAFRNWVLEMRRLGAEQPGTGACALASAMELWLWSLEYLLRSRDADGKPLYRDHRQGVTFPMADALAWIVASRKQILDLHEILGRASKAPELEGFVAFFTDLCHVQVARASAVAGGICTELVFGYNRHPAWEGTCESCFRAEELDSLEALMPGIAASGFAMGDVIEEDGTHPMKAGPCVRFRGMMTFTRLREKLDGCLTGARLAKDRAARALTGVEIPDSLDYPA